ncbi:DUF4302 domain-containing protein [Sphingobacterium sp. ML3W]|uniref:DUF4302 domain-containing protein n=1 Tax=Sphingobacterium sp. ML3W TaxID=1538644 RepID=UPI0009DEA09F|nr:DUF4302 domain-containing protein [Sphingobacterium sp. ML3W]
MKRIVYICFAAVLFMGCSKDKTDLTFEATPEERIGEKLAEVKSALVSAPYGWIAGMGTNAKGGYGFYIKFGEDDKLTMLSDYSDESATKSVASTYRVKWGSTASLIFDTYNYITLMQDPVPGVAGGVAGKGYQSDIEFNFDRISGDSVIFIGKKYLNSLILIKATELEQKSYLDGSYKNGIAKNKNYFTLNPFTTITIGGQKTEFSFDFISKSVKFTSLQSDDSYLSISNSIYHSIDGIEVLDGVLVNNVYLTSFIWEGNTISAIDRDGKTYEVSSNTTSIVPYLNALGKTFTKVVVQNATTYAGWSSDFVTRRAAIKSALGGWNISGSPLVLGTINFNFDTVNKRLAIVFNLTYGTSSTTLTYNYTYTLTDGKFKFNIIPPAGGNEAAIYVSLAQFLQERINTDTFKMEYFVDTSTGQILSQFNSIEHPNFTFTGKNQ